MLSSAGSFSPCLCNICDRHSTCWILEVIARRVRVQAVIALSCRGPPGPSPPTPAPPQPRRRWSPCPPPAASQAPSCHCVTRASLYVSKHCCCTAGVISKGSPAKCQGHVDIRLGVTAPQTRLADCAQLVSCFAALCSTCRASRAHELPALYVRIPTRVQ